jgi:hypothetical protein
MGLSTRGKYQREPLRSDVGQKIDEEPISDTTDPWRLTFPHLFLVLDKVLDINNLPLIVQSVGSVMHSRIFVTLMLGLPVSL